MQRESAQEKQSVQRGAKSMEDLKLICKCVFSLRISATKANKSNVPRGLDREVTSLTQVQ